MSSNRYRDELKRREYAEVIRRQQSARSAVRVETDPVRAEQQRRNREQYPEAAAFVDAVRAVWPEAVVTYLGPVRPRNASQSDPLS